MNSNVIKNDEKAIFQLRSLYSSYGYSQYKMNKFEEYELYIRNKDFLVSDNIITFTDTNGKLMALKPDVTLSIIKNSKNKSNCVEKLYYNENVYRVSKGTQSFKEIMQVGLECIGNIDNYYIYEVLMLACESLNSITENFVLDISHMGIISAVIHSLNVTHSVENEIIKCLGEKNVHEIVRICNREGIDPTLLKALATIYGSPEKVIAELKELNLRGIEGDIAQIETIIGMLESNGYKGKINIDFSVINNMSYYNGFVFKGFIEGISTGILSGGQYDRLLNKMGKKTGAIGFAVYLDMLEFLDYNSKEYDVDTIILYDDSSDLNALNDAIKLLKANGNTVMAQRELPEKIRYKQLVKLQERGVEILESNA